MHEPVLVPDMTLFIQMGIFFASYFVLNALVFKPYLALLKARREQTVGLRTAAERDRETAEKLRAEYDTFLKAERKKIAAWSDAERKVVQDDERNRIQLARNTAAKASDATRAVLEEERKKASKSLESSVNEFSSAIVSKMLGRNIQVSAGAGKKSSAETTVPT
jgi:F-type H+-transporting ATPase subunit b